MRKIFTITFLLACSFTYGQSLKLFSVSESRLLDSDDTVTIIVPNSDNISSGLNITNASENSVELMIRREIIEILPNAENAFCFMLCYDTDDNETIEPHTILAGETLTYFDGYFHTEYRTNGAKGISIVKYTFYDNDNLDDTTSMFFKFDSRNATGVEQIQGKEQVQVYPNPINHELQITNYEGGIIKLFNLVGQCVLSIESAHSLKTTIDVSHLQAGMYYLKAGSKAIKIIKN